MAAESLDSLLSQLEDATRRFGPGEGKRVHALLSRTGRRRLPDAASLIRFHEAVLFLRAYPHDRRVLAEAERILAGFHRRVARLLASEPEDVDALAEPEVSGIAGTGLSAYLGYDAVRDLAERHSGSMDVDWEAFEDEGHLADLLKAALPLFEDGAYAENPVPWRDWIQAAKRRGESDLAWLLSTIRGTGATDRLEALLYEGLEIPVEWRIGRSPASRTTMRLASGPAFHHREPLIRRRDVHLAREVDEAEAPPARRLPRAKAERVLALARDAMASRYRELYGFTYGDPRRVVVANAGRGVRFTFCGVVPDRRFPLLAYHAALIVKNGVLVGYAEFLSLFERTEFGLNMFYTFRNGESAWISARLLRLLRQITGVTVVSVDPYQVGHHNEEAIESGAFWFYQKLGFRPVKPELAVLAAKEERRMEARPDHRTSASTLRRLAAGHLVWEAPSAPAPGTWDRFHFREIGLAVQREAARRTGGKRRADSSARVARSLGVRPGAWGEAERRAFEAMAPALELVPGLSRWSPADKRALVRIVKAKAGPDESRYLELLQKHAKLRAAMVKLGSGER